LPHFCHHVRNHLDRDLPGRWIGRGESLAWPHGSPDLTPLDFFLWGYIQNIFYQVKINYLHLKALIRDAMATVTPTCFKQHGTRLNIIWIFVVPPREPTWKFTEVINSEGKKKH
jgi:hypothetical protein